MTINQNSPYLRTQRLFPFDNVRDLSAQVDQAYIDIAGKVNSRIVGLFALGNSIVTGERWLLTGDVNKQQTLRQIYTFSAAGSIPHGINTASITQFTKCQGEFTDGTNWYGAIFASSVAIAGQVSFYMTPTNIVILSGSGAPTITSGLIVLEWLSQT